MDKLGFRYHGGSWFFGTLTSAVYYGHMPLWALAIGALCLVNVPWLTFHVGSKN